MPLPLPNDGPAQRFLMRKANGGLCVDGKAGKVGRAMADRVLNSNPEVFWGVPIQALIKRSVRQHHPIMFKVNFNQAIFHS